MRMRGRVESDRGCCAERVSESSHADMAGVDKEGLVIHRIRWDSRLARARLVSDPLTEINWDYYTYNSRNSFMGDDC